MLRLAQLLSTDARYEADAAIPGCLGDRYLYSNNHLFRRVRDHFLACGFRYSCEESAIKRDYDAGPFFMLQDLLAEGVLPYRNNCDVLRRVLARNPRLELSPNALVSQLNRNYLLHESAHFIAYRNLPLFSYDSTSAEERLCFVMSTLAAEAFANVTEQFAQCPAESRLHALFLGMNSYVQFADDKRKLLASAVQMFGERPLFCFAFLCLLHANAHGDPPSDDLIHDWSELAFPELQLSQIQHHVLAVLASTAFTLKSAFREETSRLFFRTLNCEDEFVACSHQQFRSADLKQLGIPKWMSELSTTVFQESESTQLVGCSQENGNRSR